MCPCMMCVPTKALCVCGERWGCSGTLRGGLGEAQRQEKQDVRRHRHRLLQCDQPPRCQQRHWQRLKASWDKTAGPSCPPPLRCLQRCVDTSAADAVIGDRQQSHHQHFLFVCTCSHSRRNSSQVSGPTRTDGSIAFTFTFHCFKAAVNSKGQGQSLACNRLVILTGSFDPLLFQGGSSQLMAQSTWFIFFLRTNHVFLSVVLQCISDCSNFTVDHNVCIHQLDCNTMVSHRSHNQMSDHRCINNVYSLQAPVLFFPILFQLTVRTICDFFCTYLQIGSILAKNIYING